MQRNQNNSSHFEWSLADDSLLREKLQEFLNHVLACSTQLQNDLETINQQSLELNAEIECIVASINHISNFRFIDQHIDEDCFPTPVREVLNNVVDDKKKTLVSLTNAIRRGLEDMKNLRDINSICLTPTIIGSREFYVSISSSEATAVECFVRSSAIQAAPFLSPTFQSSVDYANEGQNDLQAPVVALTSSSLIAPSTKNSVETVSVFPSALSGISSLDKLKRLTVLSTDSDENVSCYGARAHRNGDLTISKNPTIGETVLSQSYMHDLPTFDAECCSSNSDCPPSPQVNHPMIKTSALDYSMPENLFESGDKDLKEDVFVGDSSNVKQAHVDFGKTSAIKMPVQAQITNKYADMFESDTDDELVFPHQRLSLLTSYSNKTSDETYKKDASQPSLVSSIYSSKIPIQSSCSGYPVNKVDRTVREKDESEASLSSVLTNYANTSKSADFRSAQMDLGIPVTYPLSSVMKTRNRGPTRRLPSKICGSVMENKDLSDALPKEAVIHCEDHALPETETSIPQIVSTVQPAARSTSLVRKEPVSSTVVNKTIHSFFDSESEDERGIGDEKDVILKSEPQAVSSAIVSSYGPACVTFIDNKSQSSGTKVSSAKSLFIKGLFDDDDGDDISMFRSKIGKG